MKKSNVLKLLLALSIVFLTFQFVVLPVIFQRKENQDFATDNQRQLPVRTFLSVCGTHNSPVFLADPGVLQRLDSSLVDSSDPEKLFRSIRIISFGILDNQLTVIQKELFLRDLQTEGFHLHSINQPADLTTLNATGVHVTTHYFLSKDGVVIHIVVFYTRAAGYLWHGSIELNEVHRSLVREHELNHWRHEGAFDKFTIKQAPQFAEKLLIPTPVHIFLDQVSNSLFTPCNQTRARQFLKTHPQDDSEEGRRFTRKSRQIIARAKQYLDDLGIPFWLSSGTCLGWFRQCDIITYSKDVDLGIFIKDYKPELVPTFERGGFFLHLVFGKVSDSYELSFQAGDIKLDLFFFYEESDHMWNGGTYDQTGKKYKYIFPKFNLSWTEFLGLKVRVPYPALPYIKANYGMNWSEPVKHWDWNKSPPNVRENGFWLKEEWDEVIQIY